jgi:predicted metal-dependent hydrolase
MIELKQELEALADKWHNYIGGGTMTNKEHAKQLRKLIAKYDQQQQKEAIQKAQEAVLAALESGANPDKLMDSVIQAAVEAKPRQFQTAPELHRHPLSTTPPLTRSIG